LHGSGGAGATTVAINAAMAIKRKRGNQNSRVCVLDFDIQFGQVALHLDLSPSRGILDIIESPNGVDSTFLQAAITSHKSGIDVLVAPEVLVALDDFSPDLAGQIISTAMESYDFVVIDMPVALTSTSQEVLSRSNAVVIVDQLMVPGLRQVRRLCSILAGDALTDLKIFLVLNRYLGRWKSGISIKEAEKALGRKVDCTIANDYQTASKAVDRGVPLIEVSKRSKIVKDISRLFDKISLVNK
jgi:pilus assembly protein CpaE